ncbi:MAG: hypothetical protein WCW65_02795 [Candidatus Paceibacterota bacterium]
MSNYKNYLPSKKFILIVLFIIVLIILFFSIKGVVSFFKNRKINNSGPTKVTIGEIIQKDSNDNGIADWEEYLWGLDPNKNGAKNKETILAKKGELAKNNIESSTDDSEAITENEALSREFFAAIVSLQQTGELNDESIQSVSGAVGETIKTIDIPDVYTNSMLIVENDSIAANKAYYDELAKLVTKYEDADIGNELTFIIQGLNNQDPQALSVAQTVAVSYQSFGKELIKIPVPKAIASIHLSTANNYEKTGQAIIELSSGLADPIIGMRAILNYKKYNEALGTDLEKITELLQ